MRVEPFSVDSIIHITKRGTRGMDIVRDTDDRWRFVKSLYLLNDTYSDTNWHRDTRTLKVGERPPHWPDREPLVHILAWVLLSNHFHLLVQEIQEGGTAKFMQRLGGSMSLCFNLKYGEKGSIFQSAYHSRTVDQGAHLDYLAFYILVKNVLEMRPGGIKKAMVKFDEAWAWAIRYPFSNLPSIISGNSHPIIDDAEGLIPSIIGRGNAFKKEAKDLIAVHRSSRGDDFSEVMLEPW